MEQTTQILNQVLPILLLISLGYWTRHKNFLNETTIEGLRKIVINLALPAVLFISFLHVELKSSYLFIFGFTFLLCVFLFLLGQLIRKPLDIPYSYFPYLTTGFEYGMLGISLFGAAYGIEKVGYIAVADLGHEIFIWFVFLPLLLIKRDGVQNPRDIIKSFLTAPVIAAIMFGIFFNMMGWQDLLYQLPILGAMMSALGFLSNLTVPMILIIVGYSIKFNRTDLRNALLVVVIRLGILIPLVLIVNTYLIRDLLQLDRSFELALFTLLVLPPPFIIPLYTGFDLNIEEKRYINNVLMIHTIISVTVFVIYFVINPVI